MRSTAPTGGSLLGGRGPRRVTSAPSAGSSSGRPASGSSKWATQVRRARGGMASEENCSSVSRAGSRGRARRSQGTASGTRARRVAPASPAEHAGPGGGRGSACGAGRRGRCASRSSDGHVEPVRDVADQLVAHRCPFGCGSDQAARLLECSVPTCGGAEVCIGKNPANLKLGRIASASSSSVRERLRALRREHIGRIACPAGISTTRSSTSRSSAALRPRAASPPAQSGRRRAPGRSRGAARASSASCSSVSAVPMIATDSRIPAWCRASTSV